MLNALEQGVDEEAALGQEVLAQEAVAQRPPGHAVASPMPSASAASEDATPRTLLLEALERSSGNLKEMLTPMPLPLLGHAPSFEEKVLFFCQQTEAVSFASAFTDSCFKKGKKLGEGTFGEMFMIKENEENLAIKIIPIERMLREAEDVSAVSFRNRGDRV